MVLKDILTFKNAAPAWSKDPELIKTLESTKIKLDMCEKSLTRYLKQKRLIFPRFLLRPRKRPRLIQWYHWNKSGIDFHWGFRRDSRVTPWSNRSVRVGSACISISTAISVVSQFLSWWIVLICAVSSDTPMRMDGCSVTDQYHQWHHFESVRSMESKGADKRERDWVHRARVCRDEKECY